MYCPWKDIYKIKLTFTHKANLYLKSKLLHLEPTAHDAENKKKTVPESTLGRAALCLKMLKSLAIKAFRQWKRKHIILSKYASLFGGDGESRTRVREVFHKNFSKLSLLFLCRLPWDIDFQGTTKSNSYPLPYWTSGSFVSHWIGRKLRLWGTQGPQLRYLRS